MEFLKSFSNGVTIPSIGFGVFMTKNGEECVRCVKQALAAGYRHIDTAAFYGNEEAVGQAIRESGIPREEIFVTTKIWTDDVRKGKTKECFEASLARLGLDYIDLYLIHWPVDGKCAAWLAMEELYREGKVRAIGVSNFHQQHYAELMKVATIPPMLNQIESNLAFNNHPLIAWSKEQGMVVAVWSPLGGTGTSLLTNPVLVAMAEKYGKCAAQVVIRWHLQNGVVVLPKSVTESRIIQNYDVLDFTLTDAEMETLAGLDCGKRYGDNPDCFDF